MQVLPLADFRRCVARYRRDYKVQRFSSLDHFLCLAFALRVPSKSEADEA